MLVSVVEEEWFVQLVSDSPGSGRTRRLLFREETVAALATTCAQVRGNGVSWEHVGGRADGVGLLCRVVAKVETVASG